MFPPSEMTHFPSSLTRVNVEVFVSVSPVFLFLAVSFVGTVALSPREFDGNGNYTFGLTEQVMFHEIGQDKIDRVLIMETYPLGASKRWRLVEIIEKAK